MSKKKDMRTSFSRGTMVQITKYKEMADTFWGGEMNRQYAVGKSCADCLEANCKENCSGIVETV